MPYKDPEKQKAAKRASARRVKQRQGLAQVETAEVETKAGAKRVLPDAPARDELVRLLGVQARHGSVRAIELLLRMEAPVADADDPLAELDELAQRRVARS